MCSNCGNEFGRWAGQCPACKEWNSLKEVKALGGQTHRSAHTSKTATEKKDSVKLQDLKMEGQVPTTEGRHGSAHVNSNLFSSNISEFDRVLGKGIVRGGVYLLAGEPGIGKSTLATQVLGKTKGLYVAAEESAEQIAMRVERLSLLKENFEVLETNSSGSVLEFLDRTQNVYEIVIIDSIQMFWSEQIQGAPGAVAQIRQVTMELIEIAKRKRMAMVILGHVTKEGDIAGPKLLEHMVDTVLYFEGEKSGDLRVLRVSKNRFGPTDEVGVFKMEEGGLREIKSEEINLVSGQESKIGSAVTVIMEGTRPMVVEVQALVTESFAAMPTRVFSGIDFNRGRLLVAVAQKVLGMPLYKYDVYVSVTGGIRIDDTGCDMAVVGAMWSSFKNAPLFERGNSNNQETRNKQITMTNDQNQKQRGIVLVGEVSLLGEVKRVRGWEKREKEARAVGREVVKIQYIKELKNLV